MKQPFYSHLITLTNHYPFTLNSEDASIDKPNTGDSTRWIYSNGSLLRSSF